MWDRRNLPLLMALGGSLLLHLVTMGGARTLGTGPGYPAWADRKHHARKEQSVTISLVDPEKASKSPRQEKPRTEKKPEKKPGLAATPPPAPPPAKPRIQFPEMGDKAGTGIGSNQSDGPEPLKAREADEDQALLSRKPGGGGKSSQGTPSAILREGDNGAGGRPGQAGPPVAPQPQVAEAPAVPAVEPLPKPAEPPKQERADPSTAAKGAKDASAQDAALRPAVQIALAEPAIPTPAFTPAAPISIDHPLPQAEPAPDALPVAVAPVRPVLSMPTPSPQLPEPAEPVLKPQEPLSALPDPQRPPTEQPVTAPPRLPPAAPSAVSAATGDGLRRGGSVPTGIPGHESDSDSDPFSKIGDVKFLRDGRLDIRFGRKVKTTRPHLPVVGMFDQLGLRDPSVTFKVSIDATGKVTEVTIERSSGSGAIDTPCLEAMYDWWFEPLLDATGNARPDTFLFTIGFR